MKLQPASQKEVKRIAIGTFACDLILIAGLFLLSQFDIGTFSLWRILLGALGGSIVSVFNFASMCMTVQKAVELDEKKQQKKYIQSSYNGRMLLQALWCVVALVVPQIHVLAAAAPLLFPTLTIFFLQARGKLTTPSDRKNPPPDETKEEDHLENFEA